MKATALASGIIQLTVIVTAPAAFTVESATIRDIHGPIPPDGLPPFAFSAILLLLALISLMTWRLFSRLRGSRLPAAQPVLEADLLQSLRHGYQQGRLTDMQLFEQLANLIRTTLVTDASTALTNVEIIAKAEPTTSCEALHRATAILELCDQVRFGAHRPARESVLDAIDATGSVMGSRGEGRT